jgi:thiol-disulfide isomerase/thioredoxin
MSERAAASEQGDRSTNPFLLMLIGGAALVVVGVLPRLGISTDPRVGKPAPELSLEVVHNGEKGSRLSLASLKGHPVVLDFWATWCPPCRMEAPILNRIAERYRDRGVVVVGVNTSDKPGLAGPFAAGEKLSYPIVYDPAIQFQEGDVGHAYGVQNLPTLVVVGKDGAVRAIRTGLVDESSLDALIGAEL